MAQAALSFEGNFNLVHAFHFVTFQSLLAAFLKRTTKTPFVLTASYHPWTGLYDGGIATGVMRTASVIIAQCEQERRQLLRFVEANKIVVIPCGVDSPRFNSGYNLKSTRSEYGFTEDDKIILFIGSLGTHKSVGDLVKMMPRILRRSPTAKLLVVGGGNQKSGLSALAKSLGVEQSVSLVGRVTDEVIPRIYAASDVFAFPSAYESFGIVLVEAAASGLPIVTTPVGVAAELVKHGKTGLLCSELGDSFADKVCEVLEEPDYRRNAVEYSEDVKRMYDWGALTGLLESLYDKVQRVNA